VTNPLAITPFSSADESAVVSLWHRCFPPEHLTGHNEPHGAIARKLAYQPDLFFVARIDDQIVGTTMAGYDGHRGWMYSVAVDPDHRRQGIARALLHHAEQALIALGCQKINLQVRESNQDMIAFYRRCGYVIDPVLSMGKRTC
jgi:ribosomal protein S18 acetylase RimI-like enzyme